MPTLPKFVAGNWKMHGLPEEGRALARALVQAGAGKKGVEVVVCPPLTSLAPVARELAGSGIAVGAQDCSPQDQGAYTGDVSARMLKAAGCGHVIVGHSERRDCHHEGDSLVCAKMTAAHKAGLSVILCVGEKDPKMENELRNEVVRIQLANSLAASARAGNTVIAYEPVWAIGSGLTPTAEQISGTHRAIRACLPPRLDGARIIYGGSVKPDNAAGILRLQDVNGALPGGASLKAESFLKIIEAAG